MESSFSESYAFLSQYEWIHNFQVIDIFKKDIIHSIPSSWYSCLSRLTVEELNEVPFLGESSKSKYPEWPDSLHEFMTASSQLTRLRNESPEGRMEVKPVEISSEMSSGMKSKKLHEVTRMVSLVNDVVTETNCNVVIDVGSGLGYLDHVLHQKYGTKVLGMETVQSHASAAEKRAVKQGIACDGVKSLQCHLEDKEESYKAFVGNVESVFQTLKCDCAARLTGETEQHSGPDETEEKVPRMCLIGLHCCGDLSPTMMSFVATCQHIRAMCCVCCCYHKMAYTNQEFEKFPLSDLGKSLHTQHTQEKGHPFITPFTLRLGAQETRSRWRQQTKCDHESHINHVAFRGLLSFTDEDEAHIRRKVRHCNFESIHSFVDSFYDLPSEDSAITEKGTRLLSLHDKYKKNVDAIEILTLLQVILQPVIESLIYQDRAQWLKEQGLMNVKVVPIFDELISPRNLALVVLK